LRHHIEWLVDDKVAVLRALHVTVLLRRLARNLTTGLHVKLWILLQEAIILHVPTLVIDSIA
jgi:hypothetical protein